jgi:hypothetical protein
VPPVPDARGQRPELVLFDDGTAWRTGDAPDPAHAGWAGQRVTVRARPLPDRTGPGLPVELISMAPAEPGAAAERPLSERIGEYADVVGRVSGFRPLAAGAVWGEGTLTLADGAVLPLSAPVGAVADGEAQLRVRVVREPAPEGRGRGRDRDRDRALPPTVRLLAVPQAERVAVEP